MHPSSLTSAKAASSMRHGRCPRFRAVSATRELSSLFRPVPRPTADHLPDEALAGCPEEAYPCCPPSSGFFSGIDELYTALFQVCDLFTFFTACIAIGDHGLHYPYGPFRPRRRQHRFTIGIGSESTVEKDPVAFLQRFSHVLISQWLAIFILCYGPLILGFTYVQDRSLRNCSEPLF